MAPPPDPARRRLVTPEGIDLGLRLAGAGDRFAAFLIDGLIIVMTVVAVTLLLALVMFGTRQFETPAILWMLVLFLLRNFYFALFELQPRAATPGKRALGLRVVSRTGGRLTADAVLARNLTRELEIFLPITFFAALENAVGTGLALTGLLWSLVFAIFPLFNRDRMRVGDLIAGTWVIEVPRRQLLPDITDRAAARTLAFTREQLDAYGIKELHLLEHVLRTSDPSTLQAVAGRIRQRIGFTGEVLDDVFLDAYYRALRERLEGRLLLGRRRADKYDAA